MRLSAFERFLMESIRIGSPDRALNCLRSSVVIPQGRVTDDGIEMTNCMICSDRAGLKFNVGMYAKNPGAFSRLVEDGDEPSYSPLEDGSPAFWTHQSGDCD